MDNSTETGALALGPLGHDVVFVTRNLQALLRPVSDALRAELGLETGMIGVLSIVWLNPGLSQSDLAASMVLKKSAVTKLVKTLEAQGLVTRRRVEDDRRMNALWLTAAGHELIARLRGLTDALHERLFEGIPAGDREAFFRVAGALISRLAGTADCAPD
jgi:DNA-binding MarR family transcriptional regulator